MHKKWMKIVFLKSLSICDVNNVVDADYTCEFIHNKKIIYDEYWNRIIKEDSNQRFFK